MNSEELKVLHVIGSISAVRGGPSQVIRTLTRGLTAKGVKVDVATTDDDGPGRATMPMELPLRDSGANYWIFPRQANLYTFSHPLARWLAANAYRYDLVHTHGLFTHATTAAASAAIRARVPYIVSPLGVLNRWGMENRRPFLKRVSLQLIERRVLSCAAAVQYKSEQEQSQAAILRIPHRSVVLPNPVGDSGTFPPAAGHFRTLFREIADRKLILYMSRVHPIKGLDLLIAALPIILTREPNTVLVIAGSGDPEYTFELRRRAALLGVEDHVFWAGFLEGERKRAALADADIFVLPSYSENFGLAVVEAMAAGRPVVTTTGVPLHTAIQAEQAGIITRPDVGELAAGILSLLGDDGLRRRRGNNAQRLASSFAVDSVVSQLISLYTGIVVAHRNARLTVAAERPKAPHTETFRATNHLRP